MAQGSVRVGGFRVAGMARSYGVFSWARAPPPLAVAGAGHARENGLFLPNGTVLRRSSQPRMPH
jgi:hypothetical protein